MNLSSSTSVDDYVEEFDNIYSRLIELDATYQLPRVKLILKFTDGLGDAYSSWQQSFEMNYNLSSDIVTLSVVQALARKEEQRMKRAAPIVAMMTKKEATTALNQATASANRRPRCPACNSTWHDSKGCFKLHPKKEATWAAENPEKAAA